MKLIEYKQYNNDSSEEKTLNKKKVFIAIFVVIAIMVISTISVIYVKNSNFRNFMDKYLLMKSVTENNLPSISIDNEDNLNIYAYHNYIAILKNNELSIYNSTAKKEETLQINISSPIFSTEGNYLAIAEKSKQKIYLIKDKKIIWEKNVEGEISRISVNKNGYVSVIVSGTSYKSVILTYTTDGTELFKTYLSSTIAIDSDISDDNKYLSFCETDLSSNLLELKVKTVLIENAKNNPENSIIHTYEIPKDYILVNLEYNSKNNLMCMCDEAILRLSEGSIEVLSELKQSNIEFAGIKTENSYFRVIGNMNGINNQSSELEIYNVLKNIKYTYNIPGIPKQVYSHNNVIVLNLGSEAYFINEKGWLIKKYISKQEIKNVVISENIAGIIYKNKVEILDF